MSKINLIKTINKSNKSKLCKFHRQTKNKNKQNIPDFGTAQPDLLSVFIVYIMIRRDSYPTLQFAFLANKGCLTGKLSLTRKFYIKKGRFVYWTRSGWYWRKGNIKMCWKQVCRTILICFQPNIKLINTITYCIPNVFD